MKNTNTNNAMQAIMAQAMAQGNMADMMQAIMAQAMQAGAMQAMQAMQAQGMAQGADKAQAQGKRKGADKAQAQGADAIEWQAISRQNERQTVYDVRQAMVQGKPFEGLVKAWVVLNEKKVPADNRVRKICEDMKCACLQAKGMKVKGADNAHFEVASMVTVKRAFYCAMRGMPIVETRNDVRPATRGKQSFSAWEREKAQGK